MGSIQVEVNKGKKRTNPTGVRLSESSIWQDQFEFYSEKGVQAWEQGITPQYVTTNPFTAGEYAQVVLGYLRDCCFGQPGGDDHHGYDPAQPFYIIELGAGSGRFAYHFLKQFIPLLDGSSLHSVDICYVMTDFVESNIAHWRAHPRFQPWIEAGRLDFARFDATADDSLSLLQSGVKLVPAGVRNPIVVIVNYIFDSLPLDVFSLKSGRLYEHLASPITGLPQKQKSEQYNPKGLALRYSKRRVAQPCYSDPDLDAIVQEYHRSRPDGEFSLPSATIRCLRRLAELTGGRMLLLTTDKGFPLESQGEPSLVFHGTFSFPVNYSAIGRYAINRGGEYLYPRHGNVRLVTCACIFGQDTARFLETRLAYETTVGTFSPDDFFELKREFEKQYPSWSLSQIIAYLRFTHWDARIFTECYAAFLMSLIDSTPVEQAKITETVQCVWDMYFPIRDRDDLAFDLAGIMKGLDNHTEALKYYEESLRLYGPSANTLANMGSCCYAVGWPEESRQYAQLALQLEPANKPALALLEKLGPETATGDQSHQETS